MEANARTRRTRFGAFEVDLRSGEVHKHGIRLKLQDQPFHVLAILLERPGEVVTREELRQKLWPADTFVDFDTSLNSAIKKLRDVLADSAETPRYIETLPRRGYRFIAEVKSEAAAPTQVPIPIDSIQSLESSRESVFSEATIQAPTFGYRPVAPVVPHGLVEQNQPRGSFANRGTIAGGSAALIILGCVMFYLFRYQKLHAAIPPIKSVAVLQFSNLSRNPDDEYLAESLTEELTTHLAKIAALRVVSRTSAQHYKNTGQTIPQIARELNVDAIVEGSVLHSGDKIRVAAQLIHAGSDRYLWSETYDRDIRDMLVAQNDVARDVVRHIRLSLTPDEQRYFAPPPAVDSAAYQFYLKGRYHWRKRLEYNEAIENFQRSIQSEGSFAPAYSGLADSYFTKTANEGHAVEWAPQARAAAAKALELDPSLAEAHLSLAQIYVFYDWDWAGAEREYRRAIELDNNLGLAHQQYALFLALRKRFPEAKYEAQRAEELDPVSAYAMNNAARVLFYARDYDAAEAAAKRALDLDQNYALAYAMLAYVYQQKGMDAKAFQHYVRYFELWGVSAGDLAAIRQSFKASGLRGVWEHALVHDLKACKASECIADDVATDYALLGKDKESLLWWSKACDQKSVSVLHLAVQPELDRLHRYKGFQELSRRVGLPE